MYRNRRWIFDMKDLFCSSEAKGYRTTLCKNSSDMHLKLEYPTARFRAGAGVISEGRNKGRCNSRNNRKNGRNAFFYYHITITSATYFRVTDECARLCRPHQARQFRSAEVLRQRRDLAQRHVDRELLRLQHLLAVYVQDFQPPVFVRQACDAEEENVVE